MMTEDHNYDASGSSSSYKARKSESDQTLLRMLKDLCKSSARKLGVPPFAIFQDPSLEDMALKYPIKLQELHNLHGVGEGKAKRYGAEFINLIKQYIV